MINHFQFSCYRFEALSIHLAVVILQTIVHVYRSKQVWIKIHCGRSDSHLLH